MINKQFFEKIEIETSIGIAQEMLMTFNHNPDLFKKVISDDAVFFLFPTLKTPTNTKRFATIEEINEKSKQKLLAISKDALQKCFMNWKKILA